jgi:hypothetical protein
MIGTPSKLEVHISRKLSDGDYGSFEVSALLALDLPPDANLEEAFDAADTWLTAAVAGSVREKQENIAKQKPVAPEAPVAQVVQQAPVAEIRTPVTDGGEEYRTIDVEFFEVSVDANNVRVCKVHGGPYKKYAVRCWPEPLEAVGIKLETLEAGKFSLPPEYKSAKVLMAEGKPRKVWKFEK